MKFEVIQLTPFKEKNKLDFFYLSAGMENCKMSEKNQGKVMEF